jgi:mono/diheme cytochrome c family protein
VRHEACLAAFLLITACGERARPERAATTSPPGTAAAAAPDTAPTPAGPAAAADAPLTDEYHTAPRDTISREAYNGWKQFELNCARCHGEYAVGTSFAPALVTSLKEGGTIATREAFVTTVCQGRKEKGMPSWCELGLEMDKIMGIYAYVKGRADGKIHEGRPAARENS